VTEQERLRQTITRLIEAQWEALDVCNEALERWGEDLEDDVAWTLQEKERLSAALEDVWAILGAASDDVRGLLGKDEGA
jgi:hypothetical protein